MRDLIDQLRRYAEAATAEVPTADLDAVRWTTHRRGRRRLVLAAGVAVVASSVVTAGLVLDRTEPPVRLTTQPSDVQPSETSTGPTEPPTPTTGPATTSHRTFPVMAVTDTEYLVWSGEAGGESSRRGDGFAVNISTGAVRPIPVAPINPRSEATGVWTGHELVVCCGGSNGPASATRSAAAWDPATNDWRTLAAPPESIARSFPTSVWTGELMIVIAQGPAAASYDPATDRWTEIPAPPISTRIPESVWTGQELIVWHTTYGSGVSPPDGSIADQGWSWTPENGTWTPLPPLPEGSRTRLGSIAWTGTDLVVWGLSTGDDAVGVGARWRPGDDAWRAMAPSPHGAVAQPFQGTDGSQALASASDGRVLVKGLDGSLAFGKLCLYDAAANSWTTTSLDIEGYHPEMIVAGGKVFVPDELAPVAGDLPP